MPLPWELLFIVYSLPPIETLKTLEQHLLPIIVEVISTESF